MIATLFGKPLFDLGETNTRFAGIWSPGYDRDVVDQYLTEQFGERAEEYVRTHQNPTHMPVVLKAIFNAAKVTVADDRPFTILDLGSGAGNTILPLLDLLRPNPEGRLIASDLSAVMLALCGALIDRHPAREQCERLQLNAEDLDFTPESVDLVLGCAILHHLFRPDLTIAGCGRILKPGGVAIFLEPFEDATVLEALIYQTLLQDPRAAELPPALTGFWANRAAALLVRRGENKTDGSYDHLDDKWLFTRSYFTRHAKAAGFRDIEFVSLREPIGLFENHVDMILKIGGLNSSLAEMPTWVKERIRAFDSVFSEEYKREILCEAAIILRK